MGEIKVEIGQYKEINKGAFKATFTLLIHPFGQKILDCKYFVMDEKRWFNFPQKEVKYLDGRKPDYIPLISFLDKNYFNQLKEEVLNKLKDLKPQEVNYAKTQFSSAPTETNNLQNQASSRLEGQLPF